MITRALVPVVAFAMSLFHAAQAAQVESLGGRMASEPSCVSWGHNRIDCFYRGDDQALHHRWWDGTRWNWAWLGGTRIASRPECVTREVNRIDCIAVSAVDRRLLHRSWDGTRWNSGVISEAVTIPQSGGFGCVAVGGRVLCMSRRQGVLGEHWFDGTSWRHEFGVEGSFAGSPECVSFRADRVECFVQNHRGGSLVQTAWNGSGRFSAARDLGGILTSGISCTGWDGATDCFVRGTDNALWHRWWNGVDWSGWERLDGILLDRPECISSAKARIDCFVTGTDRAMHRRSFDGTAWRGWERLGGELSSAISCTTWAPGRFDCFARGADGALVRVWEDRTGFTGTADLGGAGITMNPAVPDDPTRQWRVLNTDTVKANENYGLVNLRRLAQYREAQLGYVFRESSGGMASVFGVDMETFDWTGTSGGYFVFERPNKRDHRTLNNDENVAIYNTNAKKYLRGFNTWSTQPSYEWVLRKRVGADFAIYNTAKRAYFVYTDQRGLTFEVLP